MTYEPKQHCPTAYAAILEREYDNWVSDHMITAASDNPEDQDWANLRLSNPILIWREMLAFFADTSPIVSDPDVVAAVEAKLFNPDAPKERGW